MFISVVSSLLQRSVPCWSGESAPARYEVRAEVIEGSLTASDFFAFRVRQVVGRAPHAPPSRPEVPPRRVPWEKQSGWPNRTSYRRSWRWVSA
jgi:hypothetical protein